MFLITDKYPIPAPFYTSSSINVLYFIGSLIAMCQLFQPVVCTAYIMLSGNVERKHAPLHVLNHRQISYTCSLLHFIQYKCIILYWVLNSNVSVIPTGSVHCLHNVKRKCGAASSTINVLYFIGSLIAKCQLFQPVVCTAYIMLSGNVERKHAPLHVLNHRQISYTCSLLHFIQYKCIILYWVLNSNVSVIPTGSVHCLHNVKRKCGAASSTINVLYFIGSLIAKCQLFQLVVCTAYIMLSGNVERKHAPLHVLNHRQISYTCSLLHFIQYKCIILYWLVCLYLMPYIK